MEQEKKFIHDKLILQKDKNINERKKKEMIRKQKDFKNAERIQANKAFNLVRNQKELEAKIRIQDNINDKLNRQKLKFVTTSCNDDCVKNQEDIICFIIYKFELIFENLLNFYFFHIFEFNKF